MFSRRLDVRDVFVESLRMFLGMRGSLHICLRSKLRFYITAFRYTDGLILEFLSVGPCPKLVPSVDLMKDFYTIPVTIAAVTAIGLTIFPLLAYGREAPPPTVRTGDDDDDEQGSDPNAPKLPPLADWAKNL
eukprot:g72510.t1